MASKKWSRTYWADLGERVGATFLGAFLTMLTTPAAPGVSWHDWQVLVGILVVPTVVSLVKGLLANMADPESGPSLLPSPPAPDVP